MVTDDIIEPIYSASDGAKRRTNLIRSRSVIDRWLRSVIDRWLRSLGGLCCRGGLRNIGGELLTQGFEEISVSLHQLCHGLPEICDLILEGSNNRIVFVKTQL